MILVLLVLILTVCYDIENWCHTHTRCSNDTDFQGIQAEPGSSLKDYRSYGCPLESIQFDSFNCFALFVCTSSILMFISVYNFACYYLYHVKLPVGTNSFPPMYSSSSHLAWAVYSIKYVNNLSLTIHPGHFNDKLWFQCI